MEKIVRTARNCSFAPKDFMPQGPGDVGMTQFSGWVYPTFREDEIPDLDVFQCF